MLYLITKWFGTFLLEDDVIKNKILFPKDAKKISNIIKQIHSNKILKDEIKLSKGKTVIVNEKRLNKIGNYFEDDPLFKKILIKPEDYDYPISILQDALLEQVDNEVQEKLESKDLSIIQMINTLDDFIQISNLLSERMECWKELPDIDAKIQPLKKAISTVEEQIKNLTLQIEKDIIKLTPNTVEIIGPIIASRLISKAGSLERLAKMPASTIQLLGAEKALFRYKKEGGKPPKHGIIFQHPLINKESRENRGKIARLISGKIAIAAKADYFTKRYIADDLREEIDLQIKQIKNL